MDVLPARAGRSTLATIAASAGVSVATVSKVLNGRSDVAPATRALVQGLLQQHNYVAPSARRAEPAIPPTLEVTFDGALGPYSTEVLQGVLEGADEAGIPLVVSIRTGGLSGSGTGSSPGAWARELVQAGRRALIAVTGELTSGHLSALARARLPLVVIDPMNLPRARVTSVGSTNFAGGLAATEHLLSLGHRRIAYAGGRASAACNQARLHGYLAAMEAHGAEVLPGYVQYGHFVYPDGIQIGATLFDLPEPPTAVFAGSDQTALGVIEAARARGLRLPEELSVVGFDDTHLARMTSPPLTTVRQPLREMGRVAVRTALRLADGQEIDSHHVELATELVVRGSTAEPPSLRPPAQKRWPAQKG